MIKKSKSNVLVGTVIDFPFGDSSTEEKITQAIEVIELGVDEIDYVSDYNIYKQKAVSINLIRIYLKEPG